MRVRTIVHNCRTQQDRTVLIIFSLILQTIIIAQMMSTEGAEGCVCADQLVVLVEQSVQRVCECVSE